MDSELIEQADEILLVSDDSCANWNACTCMHMHAIPVPPVSHSHKCLAAFSICRWKDLTSIHASSSHVAIASHPLAALATCSHPAQKQAFT
jgi:hypothetical protein